LLAADIVDNVSVLRNPRDFQVVLPWCAPPAPSSGSSTSCTSAGGLDMTSVMNALDEPQQEQEEGGQEHEQGRRGDDPLMLTRENNDIETETLDAYFTPLSVSCGVRAVVSCGVEPDDVSSRMKVRKKKKALGIAEFLPEDVFMLVKVTRVGEERARVVVHTLRDSVNQFRRCPAVPANTRLELMIALPSVLTVEVC
jgi:hypothetical protein